MHRLIQHLHSDAAAELNKLDGTPRRRVRYQYLDRCLTFEKSYYPRLNCVMNNPVRHTLVPAASHHHFRSAGWFNTRTSSAFARKVASFKYDLIQEPDDFEPIGVDQAPERAPKAAVGLPHSKGISPA